jgi:hypothetical protein
MAIVVPHPAPVVSTASISPAKALNPDQRQQLAREALAGQAVRQLARQHDVSRKFVAQQRAKAEQALDNAFAPAPPDDPKVLYYLPVTQAWLRQLILSLTLTCHSSYRGIIELFRDCFDWTTSVGHVHDVLQQAVARARVHNARANLAAVRIGAHDEIFQAGRPVLVGADVESTYCYLLSLEDHRDADTWAIRLLELSDRGFDPEATIADGGMALRAGQAIALPQTPCRGDVFHILQTLTPVVTYLENRAYAVLASRSQLERKQAQRRLRRGRADLKLAAQLRVARVAEAQALTLAEDVALLVRWLRDDILSIAGPCAAERQLLFDFVVEQLRARAPQCPHRLDEVCRLLTNQKADLLAFASQLDQQLAAVAQQFEIEETVVRAVLMLQSLGERDRQRWLQEATLRARLRSRFYAVNAAVAEVAEHTVRASWVIENLNSRLRNSFFLRRQLGPDYLALLQFYLNHRRFMRSEHAERVDHSPAELLSGQAHPHWLDLLGFTRFWRN